MTVRARFVRTTNSMIFANIKISETLCCFLYSSYHLGQYGYWSNGTYKKITGNGRHQARLGLVFAYYSYTKGYENNYCNYSSRKMNFTFSAEDSFSSKLPASSFTIDLLTIKSGSVLARCLRGKLSISSFVNFPLRSTLPT